MILILKVLHVRKYTDIKILERLYYASFQVKKANSFALKISIQKILLLPRLEYWPAKTEM